MIDEIVKDDENIPVQTVSLEDGLRALESNEEIKLDPFAKEMLKFLQKAKRLIDDEEFILAADELASFEAEVSEEDDDLAALWSFAQELKKKLPKSSSQETYEDYVPVERPSGSGGGKNHPSKSFNANKENIRRQRYEDSQKEALQEIKEGLLSLDKKNEKSGGMTDKDYARYATFVLEAIRSGKVEINTSTDFNFKAVRSSSGAGGQNANKVNSAVRLYHYATGIAVTNEETRDQIRNKESALGNLQERLEVLVKNWKLYLTPFGGKLNISTMTQDLFKEIMMEIMVG